MRYIELFAGCGGLSLGLKSLGSEMLLANELSPMASETFAYNLLNEKLREMSEGEIPKDTILKTKWLRSKHPVSELAARLRENPQQAIDPGEEECDLSPEGKHLEGSLVVGSVVDLNRWLIDSRNRKALALLKSGFGRGNVDLVSGGPPCQSFSMAGMRQFSNARNVLPWEFAKFVALVRPKFVLLENVSGIMHPFRVEGVKRFAWFEVAQAFASIGQEECTVSQGFADGYVPLCLHVNAKLAGVAQNRPRFIMLAFRRDIYQQLKGLMTGRDRALLGSSEKFYDKVRSGLPVQVGEDLAVYDADKDPKVFKGTFLRSLCAGRLATVREAIDDLRSPGVNQSSYVKRNNRVLVTAASSTIKNHVLRLHGLEVKQRFRIYQVLGKLLGDRESIEAAGEVRKILARDKDFLSDSAWKILRKHTFYVEPNKKFRRFAEKEHLEDFLAEKRTSKHSQKALIAEAPAPAALSIPDDSCHYDESEENLRALSVREMARIQSFPDGFVFCSKATTGGAERKFEVPQYTQVGNAVPPLLGRALGKIIIRLLNLSESQPGALANRENHAKSVALALS